MPSQQIVYHPSHAGADAHACPSPRMSLRGGKLRDKVRSLEACGFVIPTRGTVL